MPWIIYVFLIKKIILQVRKIAKGTFNLMRNCSVNVLSGLAQFTYITNANMAVILAQTATVLRQIQFFDLQNYLLRGWKIVFPLCCWLSHVFFQNQVPFFCPPDEAGLRLWTRTRVVFFTLRLSDIMNGESTDRRSVSFSSLALKCNWTAIVSYPSCA